MAVMLVITITPQLSAQQGMAAGLKAKIDAHTGDYVLTGRTPAWEFRGSVGSPVQRVAHAAGQDGLGPFHALRFDWRWNGSPLTGEIKTYDRQPVARFELTYRNPTSHPQLNFPNFTSLPSDLHVFSYRNFRFAPPQFAAGDYGTPWLLFDDHFNAQ